MYVLLLRLQLSRIFSFLSTESLSSLRAKLISPGTVTPLNVCLDNKVEMGTFSLEKPEAFHFHKMLSTGKGVSVLEAVQQECLKAGASQLTSSIEQELINATDSDGCTLLHHAARCNKSATIKILLDGGNVDIDQVQNMGFTALHLAVR